MKKVLHIRDSTAMGAAIIQNLLREGEGQGDYQVAGGGCDESWIFFEIHEMATPVALSPNVEEFTMNLRG